VTPPPLSLAMGQCRNLGYRGGILFGMLLIVLLPDRPNLRLQLIVEVFGLLASAGSVCV
jgi:hypothetical protein